MTHVVLLEGEIVLGAEEEFEVPVMPRAMKTSKIPPLPPPTTKEVVFGIGLSFLFTLLPMVAYAATLIK